MGKRANREEFCSRTPQFPLRAYIVYFFMSEENKMSMVYPLESIYKTVSEIQSAAQNYAAALEEKDTMDIVHTAVIIPINFDRLYNLKQEFWDNPILHYDEIDRMRAFLHVAEKPQLYKLVVTPMWYEEELHLSAAIPFYISSADSEIDKFMFTSDYPVDERAKYAAIYTLGTPLRLNWKTGEISELTEKAVTEKVMN